MDAVKFFKNLYRMCETCSYCDTCPLNTRINKDSPFCPFDINPDTHNNFKEAKNEEVVTKLVNIVEKWAEEHPIKIRQSEFLKLYPTVKLNADNVIAICPNLMNSNLECPLVTANNSCEVEVCKNCKKEYWLTEV